MKCKLFLALGAAALLTISCGGVVDPSQNQSQDFSGTVTPASQGGGPYVFNFSASKSGEYSIQVNSATPTPTNNYLGVGFGQVISGSCAPITLNPFATIGRSGSASAIQPGTWCAIIYDGGNLTQVTNFQATVKHP